MSTLRLVKQISTSLAVALIALSIPLAFPGIATALTPGSNGCELSGGGTDGNPYLVDSSLSLRESADCDGQTKVFEIVSNLTIDPTEASSWPAFGTFSTPFSGTIRGNVGGSPATITIEPGGVLNGSLINYASNLTISDVALVGEIGLTGSANTFVGGFVGEVRSGTTRFLNVTSLVNVSGNTVDAPVDGVGSFVGEVYSTGTVLIISSSAMADSRYGKVARGYATGGFVGDSNGTLEVYSSSSFVEIIDSRYKFGGIVGESNSLKINDSYFLGSLNRANFGTMSAGGGLVGQWVTTGGTIVRSFAKSNVYTGTLSGNAAVGGLVGSLGVAGTNYRISDSFAIVNVQGSGFTYGGQLGGIVGGMVGLLYTTNTFANGKFSVSGESQFMSQRGGLVGFVGSNSYYYLDGKNFFNAEGLVSTAGGSQDYGTRSSINGGTAVALDTDQFATSGSFTPWSSAYGYCQNPYLLLIEESCESSFFAGMLTADGTSIDLLSETPLTDEVGDASDFIVTINGSSATATSIQREGLNSARLFLGSAALVGDSIRISYISPLTGGFRTSSSPSVALSTRTFIPVVNTSTLVGPAASFGTPSSSPDLIEIGLQCGGYCGPADSYTYVASITPAGGATTTISGTATSATTTLSFTALSPNVAHNIQTSVTYNGQTSATASTTITTPRPIATISSVVVSETTATLDIGCTNCGAAPDSYTISATPQAGGSAITSNTAVISGLSSETTYSFAVVISYAGTTSASVNWQDNPVRTLPYSPVITSVTPSSAPLSGGSVSVTGTNFSTSDQLTFGGSNIAFTIVDGNTITFTAPSATAGAVDLAIRNEVGTGSLPNAFTYVPGPSLTTNSPFVATTNGGTIVTLTGTDLSTATQVNLGSNTVSVTVVSSTKVRFVTPATTAGVVDVGIVTVGGIATLSQALEFTTSALVPVVTSITPTSGTTAGGTTITVTGQYFSGSYSDSVSAAINGVSGSSVVLVDDSTLTFVSPVGIAAIGLDITVLTGGGLGTLAGAFSYIAPVISSGGGTAPVTVTTPEILDFSTRELTIEGGTVTISGKRLAGIVFLMVGGKAATISSNTDVAATFILGELPIGVWNLELRNEYGNLTFQEAFTVVTTSYTTASGGTLLGYQWTLKFLGNSRTLSAAQAASLDGAVSKYDAATTIVCWGYTTASEPNAWAIAHATARAKAACDYLSDQMDVKAVIRLRYGVEKSYAMRSAIQFWK